MQECTKLRESDTNKVTPEMIFSENTTQLNQTAGKMQIDMNLLETCSKPSRAPAQSGGSAQILAQSGGVAQLPSTWTELKWMWCGCSSSLRGQSYYISFFNIYNPEFRSHGTTPPVGFTRALCGFLGWRTLETSWETTSFHRAHALSCQRSDLVCG